MQISFLADSETTLSSNLNFIYSKLVFKRRTKERKERNKGAVRNGHMAL